MKSKTIIAIFYALGGLLICISLFVRSVYEPDKMTLADAFLISGAVIAIQAMFAAIWRGLD